MRVEARRPVGEFLGEVIRRIGILDELDADPDRRHGLGARRNLAAFLDEVHAFEPVEGELTLRAFLDHIEAVERLDKQEWAPVQPSDADSVKVMTIHVAKGLEFDHVFVPGLRARAAAEPRRCRRTRPSAASRWTSSCAATPTSCRATTATSRAFKDALSPRRSSRSGGPPTSR